VLGDKPFFLPELLLQAYPNMGILATLSSVAVVGTVGNKSKELAPEDTNKKRALRCPFSFSAWYWQTEDVQGELCFEHSSHRPTRMGFLSVF
jgi:hypothetical protein